MVGNTIDKNLNSEKLISFSFKNLNHIISGLYCNTSLGFENNSLFIFITYTMEKDKVNVVNNKDGKFFFLLSFFVVVFFFQSQCSL